MTSGVHSRRVIFIDLGRALAVTFMLYGHTASALLAPEYHTGRWFEIWTFQRGLTSSLFLLLGGFAFSIATSRHWASHLTLTPAVGRRLRRFVLFILLGYSLHLPAARLVDVPAVAEHRWLTFVAVDVLQLIGTSLIVLQALVMACRSRGVFTAVTLVLSAAIALITPLVWSVDWRADLPAAAAAYLSQATGSLFPLFPWTSFVLFGAGLGQLFLRWGTTNLLLFARNLLLLPGAALAAAGVALRRTMPEAFGSGPGAWVPTEVMLRIGVCLVILAAIAYLSRRITRLPHVFGAVAQESLLVYFVHLCIVYGSIWNRGLVQAFGPTLPPGQTLIVVLMVLTSMAALASGWNWFKHVRPRWAQGVGWGVGALLLARLL